MAHTHILAEPATERPPRLNEATHTAEVAVPNSRHKATSHAALFPFRELIAMPLSPFMHNVK